MHRRRGPYRPGFRRRRVTWEPNFRYTGAATRSLAEHLTPGAVVACETTLPVGTTRTPFVPALERTNAVWDLDSPEAAELAKLTETTSRDLNIGFANELALFCQNQDLDVYKIIAAPSSQAYSKIYQPIIAVGGHCVPVYRSSTFGLTLMPKLFVRFVNSTPRFRASSWAERRSFTVRLKGSQLWCTARRTELGSRRQRSQASSPPLPGSRREEKPGYVFTTRSTATKNSPKRVGSLGTSATAPISPQDRKNE
ncbi:hypothetical protein DAD186_15290 [Dermabacter vaginalis]|uniref:UDP-glucose/GDP-mannose dehydrogenase dimerisation domain-containing protein n=1 Tax=Dermabacter vaginalis TaxID=1630135 RepID=A0A1B0ZJF8_9MICO|nr:hypothetical protein DAD186_15290 [Dermabacter vaginalis]